MNNTIINYIILNEKIVDEKRATRLKKTMLASALSFGIVLGSIQILGTNPDREHLDRKTKNRRSQKQPKNSREKACVEKCTIIPSGFSQKQSAEKKTWFKIDQERAFPLLKLHPKIIEK